VDAVGQSKRASTGCIVEAALGLIDGKWKGVILYHLLDGTLRFNEIRRRAPACTQRMLTNQLREMEADGLINRKVYAEVPPKVEYSLTDKGRALEPVIYALRSWAENHLLDVSSSTDLPSTPNRALSK